MCIRDSPVYMAPEQWEEEEASAKTDVYAFGVMLNEMETDTRPWQGASMGGVCRKVCRGDRPPVASGAVGQLVARCWAAEPAARPTMEQALRELAQLA